MYKNKSVMIGKWHHVQIAKAMTWSQCYKNTAVIYHGNFNPTFSRGKILQ
jgi:hypothetical protein